MQIILLEVTTPHTNVRKPDKVELVAVRATDQTEAEKLIHQRTYWGTSFIKQITLADGEIKILQGLR